MSLSINLVFFESYTPGVNWELFVDLIWFLSRFRTLRDENCLMSSRGTRTSRVPREAVSPATASTCVLEAFGGILGPFAVL